MSVIQDFCVQLQFPEEAIAVLESAYRSVLADAETHALLMKAMDGMYLTEDAAFLALLEEAAQKSGIHRYTLDLIFWILCAQPLRYIYKERNFPDTLYWDCMRDLRVKLMECWNRYMVWGVFSTWFAGFYRLKRVAFGRLEYDFGVWQDGPYRGFLENGDRVFYCHIPSGSPLCTEDVMDSVRRLHAFYRDQLKDGILAVRCWSWLVYPPIIELCDPQSNMRKFYDLFDIYGSTVSQDPYANIWRIFNVSREEIDSLRDLPEKTSFQRKMKTYFLNGGTMGSGKGVLLFDGENILRP